MATTATDNVVIKYQEPVPFPIDQTGSYDINQGDQLYMDTSAHLVKPLDNNTHAATFCGVAMDGSYIQPYSQKKYSDQIPVLTKGIVRFNTTNGDTYHEGDICYIGADAQTISNTDPGSGVVLGYAKLSPGLTTLAGGAGITVEVELTIRWPVATV